jgi:cation diffusion facilitator family transporter
VTKKVNDFLVRHFIHNHLEIANPQVRQKYGQLEGCVSIVGNVALSLIKLICGLAINSVSLIADAFHTLTDVITSVIIIISFRLAQKPGDQEHPFGYGRMEAIATLIIAVLLVVVSVEFFQSSIKRLIQPVPIRYDYYIFAMMIFSAAFKEWMYRFAKELGERIDSPALLADAWHHRTDAAASLGVGVGLLGVLIGFPQIDGLLGMAVAFLIAATGYQLGKDAANELLGKGPSEDLVETIRRHALQVKGVKGVHDIEVHAYGEAKYISAHICVDPALDVATAHDISDQVAAKIETAVSAPVLIHVDPWQRKSV